jgi:6-phosphogluconolactonase
MKGSSATGKRARVRAPILAALLAVTAASLWLGGCSDDEPAGPGASGAGASGTGASGSGGAGASGSGASGGSGGATVGSGGSGSGGVPDLGAPFVYVGQGNGEIAVFELDDESGALSPLSSVSAGDYPSFLAIAPNDRFVYAALEGSDAVAALSVDAETAALTLLGSKSSEGSGPAHVSVDASSKWVFVANYGSGTVAVLPILADGSLGDAVDTESPGQNSHLIRSDPSNAFVFVPNKGSDTISQYLFDSATGQLEENDPPSVQTADGAGPRHLDFHPSLPIVYGINESDDTLSVYDLAAGGTLTEKQVLSTLPDGVGGGGNSCADVHVSIDGKFVYGSNRGDDSIVVFAVAADSGMLTLVEHEPTGGETPRNFGLHPAGGALLVANQGTNTVVSMTIDTATGELAPVASTDTDAQPFWVGVITLPVLLSK